MTMDDSAPTRDETPYETQTTEDESPGDKIEILVDMICRPGDEPDTKSAALLVLISTFERSMEPVGLLNRAKHLVFAHYDDVTVDDMMDAQIATVEAELFADNIPISTPVN